MSKESMQKVFDTVYEALFKQGCKSTNNILGNGLCMYRGELGRKCAIGHLISDDQIKKYNVCENTTAVHLDDNIVRELVPNVDPTIVKGFLYRLQNAHDNSDYQNFNSSFKKEMNIVAHDFNLKGID